MTTLTRSQLLTKAKPKFERVEVEGFGVVCLRSVSPLQQSRRDFTYFDLKTGAPIAEEFAKSTVHAIIDQVCGEDGKPMFTDADFEELAGLDNATLGPLIAAINDFNGEKKTESETTSES